MSMKTDNLSVICDMCMKTKHLNAWLAPFCTVTYARASSVWIVSPAARARSRPALLA